MRRLLYIVLTLAALSATAFDHAAIMRTVAAHALSEDSAYALSAAVEDSFSLSDRERYAAYLEAMIAAGYPDSLRSRYILERLRPMLPGCTIPNLKVDGTPLHRLLSEGSNTIIFYDPDCHVCHDSIERLQSEHPILISSASEPDTLFYIPSYPTIIRTNGLIIK